MTLVQLNCDGLDPPRLPVELMPRAPGHVCEKRASSESDGDPTGGVATKVAGA